MMTPSHFYIIAVLLVLPVAFSSASDLDRFIDKQTVEFLDSYDKRLRYTPSTVVIFDREYIRKSGALTVAELLERVVGIHMTRKSYGASSNQYIRGIDSNLLVLQNGVENAKIIPELLSMPVVDLERVEVVKGSHYPLYGASAVVGTVNLVTGKTRKDHSNVGIRSGSLDTKQLWVKRSNQNERLGYSAYFSHTETLTTKGEIQADVQTIRDESFGTDLSLAPRDGFFSAEVTDARLTIEIGDNWTFHQLVNHRNFGTGVGLSQSLEPDGSEVVTYYTADLRYERRIGSGDFEARLTYNYVDMAYKDLTILPLGSLGPLLPDGAIQKRYSKTGNDLFVEGLYRIVIGRNTLDVGVGGSNGVLNNESDKRNFLLVPGQRAPSQLDEFAELSTTDPLFGGDYSFETAHVMLRDEYKASNNLFLNAGGRVDYSSEIGTFLIPRIGIHWIAGQYTNIGLLYGESVQTPSEVTQTSQGVFFAQGDNDLKPEKIKLLEASVDHVFNERISFMANLYAFKLEDTIAIIADPSAPNGNSFANLSENENGTGVEIVFNWNIKSNTKLSTGISAVKVRSADQSIATSPRLEPYLELNHSSTTGFNTNISVVGVANRNRRAGDERPPIDDYFILNSTVTKTGFITPGLDLSISVQNLLDADAREDISVNIPFDLPVYPRRILAGLAFRF